MSITYTWAVTGMKVTRVGAMPNYVVQTYWTKTGTDANGNTGRFSGATPFTPNPDQPSFVPYDQLTQEIVLSWIQPVVTGYYEEHVNEQIAKQIADKIDPIVDGQLPWAPSTSIPPAAPSQP
jgi:hypothetical protein